MAVPERVAVVLRNVGLVAIRGSAAKGVFTMKQVALLMLGLLILTLAGCAKVAPSMMKAAGQGVKAAPKAFNHAPAPAPGFKAAGHHEQNKFFDEVLQHAGEYGLDQVGLRRNDKNKR